MNDRCARRPCGPRRCGCQHVGWNSHIYRTCVQCTHPGKHCWRRRLATSCRPQTRCTAICGTEYPPPSQVTGDGKKVRQTHSRWRLRICVSGLSDLGQEKPGHVRQTRHNNVYRCLQDALGHAPSCAFVWSCRRKRPLGRVMTPVRTRSYLRTRRIKCVLNPTPPPPGRSHCRGASQS